MTYTVKNPVKEKLSRGEPVIGIFVSTVDPRLVEVCGQAGFDYVLLDAEHAPFSERECENLVRAAQLVGIPAFIRVPVNSPKVILRYLDIGALGVMIPGVRSAEEARAAVQAVRYAPLGSRGASTARLAGFGGYNFKQWAEVANRETMVIVQLEHKDVIDDLPNVLEVEGIDAFEMGQADLTQSFGVTAIPDHPQVQEYIERAMSTVLSAGRVLGDTTNNPQEAAALIQRGFRMVACSLNALVLAGGSSFVNAIRTETGSAA